MHSVGAICGCSTSTMFAPLWQGLAEPTVTWRAPFGNTVLRTTTDQWLSKCYKFYCLLHRLPPKVYVPTNKLSYCFRSTLETVHTILTWAARSTLRWACSYFSFGWRERSVFHFIWSGFQIIFPFNCSTSVSLHSCRDLYLELDLQF